MFKRIFRQIYSSGGLFETQSPEQGLEANFPQKKITDYSRRRNQAELHRTTHYLLLSLSLYLMSDQIPNLQPAEPKARPVGGTEHSWCKAVPGGTGITVIALLLSKPPNLSLLQTALHNLQNAHPLLRSKLHYSSTTNTFSFITPPTSHLQITPSDLSSSTPSFHKILEHELSQTAWFNPDHSSYADTDVMFASVYTLEEDARWAVVLRFHTSACDRTSAVSLLRELLGLLGGGGVERGIGDNGEVSLGIEEYIPSGKANKPFWARGKDVLGYSLNSLRLANLNFGDVSWPRCSQVVRLQMNPQHTDRILAGCKSRGIKLWGIFAAAAMIAARSSKGLPEDQWEKYSVTTLIDCRSILDPVLSSHHFGFYHSAIVNTHDIKGGEKLWELAKRSYMSFENAKNNNKHFSDMADLNFLMCKAIENPGLTPSTSMRTSLISVFENPVIDDSNKMHQEIGLEDYIGCSSVHGIGPSIAIFDTIRDGQLDCACVYPSPLHSREQMQELVDEMKRILEDGCRTVENEN